MDDDFLLAATGRVLGLAGIAAIIIIVAATAVACLRLSRAAAPSLPNTWIAAGAAAVVFGQLFLAAGGVLGVIPETGVPVPLASGSGTSLLCSAVLLGLAARSSNSVRLAAIRQFPEAAEA